MRKFIGIGLLFAMVAAATALPRPRFERLLWEHNDQSTIDSLEVYHDREGGAEFVCATSTRHGAYETTVALSCIPTGRSWK